MCVHALSLNNCFLLTCLSECVLSVLDDVGCELGEL